MSPARPPLNHRLAALALGLAVVATAGCATDPRGDPSASTPYKGGAVWNIASSGEPHGARPTSPPA